MSSVNNLNSFIRKSCERQNATNPQDFIGMSLAWGYAQNTCKLRKINEVDLSNMIDLVRNCDDVPYRSQIAMFANGREALNPSFIRRQLRVLLMEQGQISANEFYIHLMEIHPWDDGNGRVGDIVFNWLNGSLWNPVNPQQSYLWEN